MSIYERIKVLFSQLLLCYVNHYAYIFCFSYSQDVDGLVEEVQEARRIRLLHQPSKVHYCLI